MPDSARFAAVHDGDAEFAIAFEQGPGDALERLECTISNEKGVVETKGAIHGHVSLCDNQDRIEPAARLPALAVHLIDVHRGLISHIESS